MLYVASIIVSNAFKCMTLELEDSMIVVVSVDVSVEFLMFNGV